MTEILALVLIAIGVLFNVSGCIGLVRFPDVYNRIQASTKCVAVGTSFIIVGSVFLIGTIVAILKGLVCIVFILVTSSTAAHALARAAHRSGVPLWSGSIVDKYQEDIKKEAAP